MIDLGVMRGSAAEAVARGAHAIGVPCGNVVTRRDLPGHRSLRLARPVQQGFGVAADDMEAVWAAHT